MIANLAETESLRAYETVCGTLTSLGGQQFDTIIYIDVLEHIENDREELNQAASHLRPGVTLLCYLPRTSVSFPRSMPPSATSGVTIARCCVQASPASLKLERIKYIDSVGMILSAANMLLLRQSIPTKAQLHIWDTYVIPVSRVLDRCLFNALGKSIIGIWQRELKANGTSPAAASAQ